MYVSVTVRSDGDPGILKIIKVLVLIESLNIKIIY